MGQWYCFIAGRQYGPVSEDDLRAWIRQGRVRPADRVWTDGMGDWAAAGSVPNLFDGADAVPVQTAAVHVSPPGGTGGQTPNAELNLQAREILRGRWGLAIGFCLLLTLINIGFAMLNHIGRISEIRSIGNIVSIVLSGPLQLGVAIFFLTFIRAGQAEIGMLFAGFKNFGSALVAHLLMTIFIILWMLLLIIPGIIAALAYSQTFYLLADNPALGPLEAIRRSREIMRGYKWKLFCLALRYFCWSLLCLLTLGIGYIFLMPYMSVGYARFYDDLHPSAGGNGCGRFSAA